MIPKIYASKHKLPIVIVCDDDLLTAFGWQELLSREGLQVVHLWHPDEMMIWLKTHSEGVQGIILDCLFGAWDLRVNFSLAQLRQICPDDTKIVIATNLPSSALVSLDVDLVANKQPRPWSELVARATSH